MTEPFFSIIIPTRNRADLLRDALRSAVNQTFDDYEIVISNNWCSDHTDAVVAEFEGSRIRYVRTSSLLSQPDHWEYVLQFARGRYITYLCDDDALTPDALTETAKAIMESGAEFVVSTFVPYFPADWYDVRRRNSVMLFRFTGESRVIDSAATVRELFTCREDVWAPRMLNSFGRRDVIMAIHARAGRLFWMCSDFSFASCVLTTVPTWLLLDAPLRLFGFGPQSVGASMGYNGGRAQFSNFEREMGSSNLFQRAPVPVALTPNMICETLLMAKERLPDATRSVDLDRPAYFAENLLHLNTLEANGADVRQERAAFETAIAREDDSVRKEVHRVVTAGSRRRLRSRLLPVHSRARSLAWRLGLVGSRLFRGDECHFGNIAECAAWVGRWYAASSLGMRKGIKQ